MDLQPKFRTFHQTINLGRYDAEATLREKRDRVLSTLRQNCKYKFEPFNQGSYEMGTGIKPVAGDYDIDVGIVINLDEPARFNPVTIKGYVHEAVIGHTKNVRWKEPCITVQYQQGGEPVYHVDLAVYGKDKSGRLHLARGKENAGPEARSWELADPKGLTSTIGSRWADEDAAQFRRVVQYLKRWKDVHFSPQGNAAPVGIALTVLANKHFSPSKSGFPVKYDELAATRNVVSGILGGFQDQITATGRAPRLVAQAPVAPHTDTLAGMTNQQMTELKSRVDKLKGWLDEAARTGSTAPLRQVSQLAL